MRYLLLGTLMSGLLVLAGPALDARARVVDTVAGPVHQPDDRLSQPEAERMLRAAGIPWRSNGHCADRDTLGCTSFSGLRWSSLTGLLDFAQQSRCPLMISGGTERGHAAGTYTHWNGYKIDVMPGRCVDAFIERTFRYVGERGDGAPMYRAPTGFVYADEHSTHWDIVFTPRWLTEYRAH